MMRFSWLVSKLRGLEKFVLLFWFVCYVANLISSLHCAHWPLPLQHQATPPILQTSPLQRCCFLCLSLSSLLFLFLCSFSYLSSDSSTLSFLRLPSSVVPSFLSSCRRGMQPNVKRGNLIVLVAFAAFTPTVCPTQKVKTLQWWNCDMQVDHHRPHPDPTHCRDGAPCPGEMCITQ